jgi:5-hydroxyisourate hydrolase
MSLLTTHILDTTKGKPAKDVPIILYRSEKGLWVEVARGITNNDGRIADLLQKNALLEYGNYKMRFETKEYFDKQGVPTFYPFVEIVFTIAAQEHYHIPLLLNPFGYSTYRGS